MTQHLHQRKCADCAHLLSGDCHHPKSPRDNVTGRPERAAFMRQAKGQADGLCGPVGLLFEARASADVAEPRVQGVGQPVN